MLLHKDFDVIVSQKSFMDYLEYIAIVKTHIEDKHAYLLTDYEYSKLSSSYDSEGFLYVMNPEFYCDVCNELITDTNESRYCSIECYKLQVRKDEELEQLQQDRKRNEMRKNDECLYCGEHVESGDKFDFCNPQCEELDELKKSPMFIQQLNDIPKMFRDK